MPPECSPPRVTPPGGIKEGAVKEVGGGRNSPPLEWSPQELEAKSDGHEDTQSHPQAPRPPEPHGPGRRQRARVSQVK